MLRQNLIAEQKATSAAAITAIGSAPIGYTSTMLLQHFIDSACMTTERELFGQNPLNEIHWPQRGDKVAEQIRVITERLMPLREKCQKMMMRSLASIS